MDVERVEDWIGREVLDAEANKLGKLKEVYYRGDKAEVGEVKPAALSRKRLFVPLAGAVFARDSVTVDSVTDDHDVSGLETASDRTERLAELAEVEAEAARTKVAAEDAVAEATEAEEASRLAAARAERVRNRTP